MKKTQKTQPTDRLTFYPSIPQATANEAFIKSIAKPVDGANTYLEKFLVVADSIIQNMRSFSVQDVMYSARPFDIPIQEIQRLFSLWTEKMIQLGKLERVKGAYDYDIFISQ